MLTGNIKWNAKYLNFTDIVIGNPSHKLINVILTLHYIIITGEVSLFFNTFRNYLQIAIQ